MPYIATSQEILQSLYDSEINFSISTFWDGGFDWKLGNDMSGFKAEGTEKTLTEAVDVLTAAALTHYPDSSFARLWNLHGGQPDINDRVSVLAMQGEGRAR